MKIGIGQINSIIGDLEGNVARCEDAIRSAAEQGAELVALPEMILSGYPPRDMLFNDSFVSGVQAALDDLAERVSDYPPAIVGAPVRAAGPPAFNHPNLLNAALLLHEGRSRLVAAKRLLPSYDVFYEARWFVPGEALPPIDVSGTSVGVLVCEDLWDEEYNSHPGGDLLAAGAELLICISGSPFRHEILDGRIHHARRQAADVVYVNAVGANDEIIFDGHSFVVSAAGQVTSQLPGFVEQVKVVDTNRSGSWKVKPDPQREIFQALTLGIHDFAKKNRLPGVVVGLSGGIDSAVVAVLATGALGPQNVLGVAIPSRYSDLRSTESARELAANLEIAFEVVDLDSLHQAAEASLPHLEGGTAAENIQARLRSMILMSFVNQRGGFLLNTSNKTELSLGYGTLYGDLSGALWPIADLTKMQVYDLARWMNRDEDIIPAFMIDRPPSAELKADQVDPFDYPTLAPQLEALIQADRWSPAIASAQHKRWQSGVILKLSERAFGTGRLMPITRR
ncbi:MAG: NAD(+) synthase [Chloroflexi bacterium]|nr:NAD(+) synthase [Chloroflexota bacterium]